MVKSYFIGANAERTVAMGPGAAKLKGTVLDIQLYEFIAAVNGQDTPAVGLAMAVVVVNSRVIGKLGQAIAAAEAHLPAEGTQPVGIGAVVEQFAVV